MQIECTTKNTPERQLHSTDPPSSTPPAPPFPPPPFPPLKHMGTMPRGTSVSPRGRLKGCGTGVSWRGGSLLSSLYGTYRPHRGTPVSHPTGRPRSVTRMCHGVVLVRISARIRPTTPQVFQSPTTIATPHRLPPAIPCPRLTWRGACPKSGRPLWDTDRVVV